MSLSSTSGPESNKNIISQALASSPQGVPDQDKLTGKENKQVQQTRAGFDTQMQSDAKLAGVEGKGTAVAALEGQGLAATASLTADSENLEGVGLGGNATAQLSGTAQASAGARTETSGIKELAKTQVSGLSTEERALLQEIQSLVSEATSGTGNVKFNLTTPELTPPKITPRQDVSEIAMALAKAISALGESTAAAVSNYMSTQAQADLSNKISLEKQGLKIEAERKEFQKMKELEAKAKDTKTLDAVNTACIAISVTLAVVSVVVACFTCGAGLIGLAATAAVGAGAAAATSTATAVATQITMQAVIQAIKTAVVEAIKQAITQAIKIAIKQGIKAAVKFLVKTLSKAAVKAATRIFSSGKNIISKSFPKLSKVMNALGNKWVGIGISMATAVPSLIKGIGQIDISNKQQELAQLQKEVGKLLAQSEMLKMFTQFWMQASKIAAKQTSQSEEMTQQATKLGAQIGKAFAAISAGLASAV